jgi:hypothetical protein
MCKKSNNADGSRVCGIDNPMQNLSWLREKVESLKAESLGGQVKRYRYEGQDIISIQAWVQSCYPCSLYTCFGQPLSPQTHQEVFESVVNNTSNFELVGEF